MTNITTAHFPDCHPDRLSKAYRLSHNLCSKWGCRSQRADNRSKCEQHRKQDQNYSRLRRLSVRLNAMTETQQRDYLASLERAAHPIAA